MECENHLEIGHKKCPHRKCSQCGFYPKEIERRKQLPLVRDPKTGLMRKFIIRRMGGAG